MVLYTNAHYVNSVHFKYNFVSLQPLVPFRCCQAIWLELTTAFQFCVHLMFSEWIVGSLWHLSMFMKIKLCHWSCATIIQGKRNWLYIYVYHFPSMRKFREWNPLLIFDVAVVVLFVLLWEFCWNIVFPECCHVCVKELYLVRTWVVCSCVHSQMLPLLLEQLFWVISRFYF